MECDAWVVSLTDRKPEGVIGQYNPRSSNNYAEVRGRERYIISTWVSPGFFAGAPLMQPTGMADTSRYSWACEISTLFHSTQSQRSLIYMMAEAALLFEG